ncbi:MAG: SDR family oxidoreductase [Candidatus Lokiarchaeota archaeon]|nr:SDR family oxidoreductase [Candidatus Lokiarchaeota archaeon]
MQNLISKAERKKRMLKDNIALVTGSTRNIGLGIVKILLKYGALVYINGRSEKDVIDAREKFPESDKNKIFCAPGDLSDEEEVKNIFQSIKRRHNNLDILVNNACNLGIGHSFLETPFSFFTDVMNTNCHGLYFLSQLVAKDMVERDEGGVIINISSIDARMAIRGRSAYITSKGAVESLTRAMALELAEYNIRVNCISPGYTYTERWKNIDEEEKEKRRDLIPLHKEALPEDIGEAVAFLASSCAKNITGIVLPVAGGLDIQNLPKSSDI